VLYPKLLKSLGGLIKEHIDKLI